MPTFQEIKVHISRLNNMSDFEPSDFCEEGGMADSLARQFRDKLKPTQLRKVFHELKQIQQKVRNENQDGTFDRSKVLGLLPLMAFSCGRKLIPEEFYELMKICLHRDRLKTNKDFLQIVEFVSAILAYHKFHNKS
jgi:CRISPR-associated protein Csm2